VSENKTRLVAAGPPGREPGGLLRQRGLPGLEAADGDDLVLGPDLDGEGAGPSTQNGEGAVVERLQSWDDAATTDPDEGGGEELGWKLAGQLDARVVPRQGNSRGI
jgi:hypothetical protein